MFRAFSISFTTVLAMVAVICLLDFFGLPRGSDKLQRVTADFNAITASLTRYQARTGSLPTTKAGLRALVECPQGYPDPTKWHQELKKIPQDPWKHDYHYRELPTDDPRGYELRSDGRDGIGGTEDDLSSLD